MTPEQAARMGALVAEVRAAKAASKAARELARAANEAEHLAWGRAAAAEEAVGDFFASLVEGTA